MKILFIADVVGRPGRRAVKELVPKIKAERAVDFIIANAENSAGGAGITPKTAEELFDAGVDVLTSGDHLWDQKEVMTLLESEPRFLRPLNYPAGTIGRGAGVFQVRDLPPVGVMNAQGRTFMPALENPFNRIDEVVEALRRETKILFLDMHAEATSEKIAMARFLDGRASAVVGTHTHVQTADERILPGGCAFLCDGGFTGPHESILGREIAPIIGRFRTCMPARFDVASGEIRLQGALIEVDEATGKALRIDRVSELLRNEDDAPA